MWFNDFLRALAEPLKAIAWPTVAILLVMRHKARIDDLLGRLREAWGGAKFDPPLVPPQMADDVQTNPLQVALNVAPPATPTIGGVEVTGALPQELAVLRTSVVRETEAAILASPELAAITVPAVREQALLTASAALAVLYRFERVEAAIWQSQIDLLHHLNGLAPQGASLDVLRKRFYDLAASLAKDRYESYPFDDYIEFLRSYLLITNTPGGVAITEFGREYLVWRARDGRAHRPVI